MRSAEYGVRPGAAASLGPKLCLEIFRRTCRSRYFDLELSKAVVAKRVTYPVYMSLGQESVAAALSLVFPKISLCTQHRCHSYFIAFG
ncbi:hypothetical protein FDZ71_07605, partial [bacterium]